MFGLTRFGLGSGSGLSQLILVRLILRQLIYGPINCSCKEKKTLVENTKVEFGLV